MMTTATDLLSKRALAKLFEVSETTVSNWHRRGLRPRTEPGPGVASGWGFDLAEVLDWRRAQTAAGRPPGGRPLERLPRCAWDRPDHLNGCRWLAEEAVRSYLWAWFHHAEGLPLVLGLLREAHGGDRGRAAEALGYVVWSLFAGFGEWVTKDRLNAELTATGRGLDRLWESWTAEALTTAPPAEAGPLDIPDWLNKPPDEFVRDHWPDQAAAGACPPESG
jgi:hypothetical protein